MQRKTITNQIINKIIESSILAPSSHNTQPWLIAVDENKLFFFVDQSRRLLVADPTDRELYISIGCCIANAIVQAESLGLETKIKLFPQKNNDIFVAKVELIFSDEKKKFANLQEFIKTRLSNRSKYQKDKIIPPELVKSVSSLVKKYQADLHLIQDQEKKAHLADLTRTAIARAISTPAFRNELTQWMRHNWTKKTDGMPGYASGMSGAASILFPALIHSSTIPKEVSESEYEMVMNSSGIGVLCTQEDNPTHWVQVGIALELIWLFATKEGLCLSLLSGAVEFEEERKKVKKLLKTNYFPCVFFRIGYATTSSKPSPRRTVEDVVRPLSELSKYIT